MENLERWQRLGRWFMTSWVLFVVPTAVSVFLAGPSAANLAVVFAFVSWAVVWAWLWQRAIGRGTAGAIVGLVGLTVILTMFTLISPSPDNSFLVFAFMVSGIVFPLRRAAWVFLALVALQVVLSIVRLAPTPTTLNLLINSVLVGGVAAAARLFWASYEQLIHAREQLAHLAVTEERLRFARDLHDLLGQNLAVLVLKSELVAKQLPDDADESLRAEVRDIASVSRKSLNDVREAVAGYRRPTLQAEISSARTALRAAGIGLRVEDSVGTLPQEQDGVLAWCLREAVTNVVKHSNASECAVHLSRAEGSVELDVSDDGRGASAPNGGSGLDGLRERVQLVGGRVAIDADGGAGWRVHVTLPSSA